MGMGISHWEWEGMGLKKIFPLISTSSSQFGSAYEHDNRSSLWASFRNLATFVLQPCGSLHSTYKLLSHKFMSGLVQNDVNFSKLLPIIDATLTTTFSTFLQLTVT